MFRALARLAAVGLFGLLLHPSLATAAAVRWNNAAGGNWNVPANWSPAAVPTATDTAVIDLAGTYTVTMNVNVSISAVRISGAASGVQTLTGTTRTVTLANASSIGAQGVLSLTSSTVNGAGALTNDGSFTQASTSVAQALTNNGAQLVTGTSSAAGAYANAGSGTLRVQGTAANSAFTSTSGFTNSGSVELTSSGGAGAATLAVTTGTLVNAASGTISALAGSGGARNLTAAFNNQGLITIATNTTTNK